MELEQYFPGLNIGNYKLTSPKDDRYNCVAWAVDDTTVFWDDVGVNGYYWPPNVSAETLDGWKEVFALRDYVECDSDAFDPDLEKIAIYSHPDGSPSHVARQIESGKWTSKLGVSFDIEHVRLDSLNGEDYGSVGAIMQRPNKIR